MAGPNRPLSTLALLLALLAAQLAARPAAARKLLARPGPAHGRRLAVYNGQPTTSLDFVIPLEVGGGLCTGTYISPYHVLTAAHCVLEDGGELAKPIIVGGEPAVSVAVNAGYRPRDSLELPSSPLSADLAVIRVARPFAGPVPGLPAADARLAAGAEGAVVGYGDTDRTDAMDAAGTKRIATVKVLDGCPTPFTDTICAGVTGNQCPGDSGGPLLMSTDAGQVVVVGVVSHSPPCGSMADDGEVEWGHYVDVREHIGFVTRAMQE